VKLGNEHRRDGDCVSKLRRRLGLLICVTAVSSVAAGVLARVPAASAFSQRGHTFAFSFAGKGEGAGLLSRPEGVAVNEASGDVYVVDAANERVERFSSSGEFIGAWGWGVGDGKSEYEICTSSCKAGIAGEGEGQMDSPTAIAVDNATSSEDPSREDVYVLADTAAQNNVIEKFTTSGGFLGELHFVGGEPGALGGVAVDSSGMVSVSDLGALGVGQVLTFNDAKENVPLSTSVSLEELGCAETQGLAVDSTGDAFYVSHQLEAANQECPEASASTKNPAVIARLGIQGEVESEALDYEDSSAVAVDQASAGGSPLGEGAKGDVYVDNLANVAVFNSGGALIERFGSAEELKQGSGVAVNSKIGDVYVADAKGDRVDVFAPESAGPPSVDDVTFNDEDPTSTRLRAQIDPHGADTHYYFQYGTADCRASAASCTDLPAPPGEDLGAGFGAQAVGVLAQGLEPGTTYYDRVIAVNEHGEAEGSQSFNTFTTLPSSAGVLADDRAWELVSPPEKHGALIYPIGGTSEASAPAVGAIQAAADGGAIAYAANAPIGEGASGNRAPEATQVISTRGGEGWSTQDVVTPHNGAEGIVPVSTPSEYVSFSPDLSTALVEPYGLPGTRMQEPSLTEALHSEERGLYLRRDGNCHVTPGSCLTALVTPQDDTAGAQFGGELEFAGASPDLRHVIFSSGVALSATAPSAPGLYEWSEGKPAAEALQLVSVLPGNKKAAAEPQLGDFNPEATSARSAVSSDGSRVFFSAKLEERGETTTRLFMRDTTSGQTIVLNAAQGIKEPSASERAVEEVHFRTASPDGSRVFFTDNFPLTAQSRLRPTEEGPPDLYVCEIAEGAEGPHCKLTDLTVDPGSNVGESAEVVGTLPGTSEDGSYVYFVANGVLSEQARTQGARPGDCARFTHANMVANPNATCNLYVDHYDQQTEEWEGPRFIARLSQEDSPDWGNGGIQNLAVLTSRVSPNGRYLAFMSKEPLTGYDNVDQSEAAHGARDEEVYLYDAKEGTLECASCNPAGAQPKGVLDREASGEGDGLLVDRFGVWQEDQAEEKGGQRRALDHWLAGSIPGYTPIDAYSAYYQSRYLSDEGRLFFDSPDELVGHAHNGKENVYEYEPQGLGSCQSAPGCVALISSGESEQESAFLDASENGEDVFFLTDQPLSPADHDSSFDVYDAHVCSEASPCIKTPPSAEQPCEALQTCRAAAPAVPVFYGPSGTATYTPTGNQTSAQSPNPPASRKPKPLTRAQKLAKALTSCRTRHRRSKTRRLACERKALRAYQARKATRTKRKTAATVKRARS
jgi:DNA-binding beta-propeller fold protein YncE